MFLNDNLLSHPISEMERCVPYVMLILFFIWDFNLYIGFKDNVYYWTKITKLWIFNAKHIWYKADGSINLPLK